MGNVKLVRGLWNDPLLRVLENFPAGRHDGDVDALSGAHQVLCDHSNGAWTGEKVRELMWQSERQDFPTVDELWRLAGADSLYR